MEITEIGLLTIKAESTYGTDPTPTLGANIIPTVRDSVTYEVSTDRIERSALDGSLERLAGFNVLPRVTMRFRYELRGNRRNGTTQLDITNGTSTQALEIHPLLAAADLAATYTAAGTPGSEGSSAGSRDGYVTYKPTTQATVGSSVTCYFYTRLKLHKLIGGKVDFRFIMEAGRVAYIEFTVTGKYVAVADNTFSTSGAAYLDVKPPTFDGATLTIASYTPVISSLEFGIGNQIALRPDATATYGHSGFVITDRMPKGRFNPESIAEADHPFWADMIGSTTRALVCLIGSSAGNKMQATLNIEFTAVNYQNRDKTRVHDAQFDIVRSLLGDTIGNQFQLKFF